MKVSADQNRDIVQYSTYFNKHESTGRRLLRCGPSVFQDILFDVLHTLFGWSS